MSLCLIRNVYSFQDLKKKKVQEHTFSFSQHMATICWNSCPSFFSVENMSSGEQQYIMFVFSVPVSCMFFCRCVQEERASLQLSGSDFDLTRPLSVRMKLHKPCLFSLRACTGRGKPPSMCLCVSESARFTRVTTVEAVGALSCFARLRRAAACWPLKGLCLLHA